MRSLEPFYQTISLPSAAVSIEIGNESLINPAEALREEILLELPTIPSGENGDDPKEYHIDPKYLAVDKPTEDGVNPAPAAKKPNPWAALDAIDPQN